MNFSDLAKVVKDATDAIDNSEKLMIPILAVRARKAIEEYPGDITLVGASNVFSRMEEKGKVFITRGELKGIYNDLYVKNTKFAEVFTEVGASELATPTYAHHDENENNFIEDSFRLTTDPILSNALSEVFEESGVYKPYSNDLAVSAEKACLYELNSIGASPKRISVFAGKQNMIVCKASYETPKGISDVLVPVEISDGKPLLPTIFLSRAGFLDLRLSDIKEHILQTAGKSYNIDGEKLLKALDTAKYGSSSNLSDVDRAIMKLAAAKETPAVYASDGVVYQELEKPIMDVQVPEYEQSSEVQSFAKRLDSAKGAASFLFGESIVEAGNSMIQRAFASFGYKNVQVAVADNDKNNIYYAVSLGSAGMKVPVVVKEGRIQSPKILLATGHIYDFSAAGVKEVINAETKDVRMMGVASPMYDLKASELIVHIKEAMKDNDLTKAESALASLAVKGDESAYTAGLAVYMDGLNMKNNLTKNASKLEEKVKYEVPAFLAHKVIFS